MRVCSLFPEPSSLLLRLPQRRDPALIRPASPRENRMQSRVDRIITSGSGFTLATALGISDNGYITGLGVAPTGRSTRSC